MDSNNLPCGPFRRLPGLFRPWELAHIIEAGRDYRIEDAGEAGDGTVLYAVYRSMPTTDAVAGVES